MKITVYLSFLVFFSFTVLAQDPLRFEKEVNAMIEGDSAIRNKKITLFTGSSSIRMWKDVRLYFPNHNVLNRGFGGSHTSDLLYYFDSVIRPYKSKQIFIYEGDNDIADGKSSEQILATTDSVLKLIRSKVSKRVRVVFITPKPSIARWHLKDQYVTYNSALKNWTNKRKRVQCADVWTPMLDSTGIVRQDIFIEDGLHLNKKGYDIWAGVISKYIR